ncbi:hypothetical protein CHARACLAT_020333 [Characodon lateralis]|uniref:Uncharacterized protein n=1 Tax=Characodon lateralis TaxID=208331 RepID=A0ABU7F7Q9_9TELE|nr:hypothetical protein [Characodon lateralis]
MDFLVTWITTPDSQPSHSLRNSEPHLPAASYDGCALLPFRPACLLSNYYWEDTFGPLAHRLCPRTPKIFATGKPQT